MKQLFAKIKEGFMKDPSLFLYYLAIILMVFVMAGMIITYNEQKQDCYNQCQLACPINKQTIKTEFEINKNIGDDKNWQQINS